jgi:hypothetical protein
VADVLRAAKGFPPAERGANGGEERSAWRIAPLAWSAVVSAAAAVIVLTMAMHQYKSTSSVDSITPMFNATEVQLPQ